jgi:hypothetical protein
MTKTYNCPIFDHMECDVCPISDECDKSTLLSSEDVRPKPTHIEPVYDRSKEESKPEPKEESKGYSEGKKCDKCNIKSGFISYQGHLYCYECWKTSSPTTSYTVYESCNTHPEITLPNGGLLTGGRDEKQQQHADFLLFLDDSHLRDFDFIFDTAGTLSRYYSKKFKNDRVMVYDIVDRGIPDDLEYFGKVIKTCLSYLRKGKHVHVHCIGGHGRTGMILSILIGKLTKYPDPVEWVRKNYCKKAVESLVQHNLIWELTGKSKPNKGDYETKSKVVSTKEALQLYPMMGGFWE